MSEDKERPRATTLTEALKPQQRGRRVSTRTIDVTAIDELREVRMAERGDLRIGAGLTLMEISEDANVGREAPLLIDAIEDTRLDELQIPLSDVFVDKPSVPTLTALMALGVYVEIRSRRRSKMVHIVELVGPEAHAKIRDYELVTAVYVPQSVRGSLQVWEQDENERRFAATLFVERQRISKPRLCVADDKQPLRLFAVERVMRNRPPPTEFTDKLRTAIRRDLTAGNKPDEFAAMCGLFELFVNGFNEHLQSKEFKRDVRRERRIRKKIGFFGRNLPTIFLLLMVGIVVFGGFQLFRASKGRDFRSNASIVLRALSSGDETRVDELFANASPVYRERVIKEELQESAQFIHRELGPFVGIVKVNRSEVTKKGASWTGQAEFQLAFVKAEVKGNVSFHFYNNSWRLLGFGLELPDSDLSKRSVEERECVLDPAIEKSLKELSGDLRRRRYSKIYENASDVLRNAKTKDDFVAMLASHEDSFGRFVRKLDVLDCKASQNTTRFWTAVLLEYANTTTKAVIEWGRVGQTNSWALLVYRVDRPVE